MFKDWPIIDWPNHWSCMCIFLWSFIVAFGILFLLLGLSLIATALSKKNDAKKFRAHVEKLRAAGHMAEADILQKQLIKDGILKDGR